MTRLVKRHLIGHRIGSGRFAWPVCTSTRQPVSTLLMTDDPEQVDCLRCLDIITRPEVKAS